VVGRFGTAAFLATCAHAAPRTLCGTTLALQPATPPRCTWHLPSNMRTLRCCFFSARHTACAGAFASLDASLCVGMRLAAQWHTLAVR